MQDDAIPTPPSAPDDRLADLLDEAVALEGDDRERFLADLASREPATAREVRELIAVLPDPETRAAAEKVERGESDPFVGEPVVGDAIGGCVLDEVLGRGGIGTVFGARQLEPARSVAVKILRLAGARASHLRRFRNEALALGRLVHPTLARIYASGTERLRGSDLPYIVMERIEGAQSFTEWASAPRRSRDDIVRALATVCDGMQHGHTRGVVHRDLKPSNVLVGSDGLPHIIDFGVARLVGGDAGTAVDTLAGSLIGTPAYMAPEQFLLAPGEIDARIDIHALGVILYEALTGRRPYEIPRHLYFDAARIIRDSTPAAPHLVDSTIPLDLSAVVMTAMAKDRDKRYVSMSAFAEDLRAFLDGRAVRARPESSAQRLTRAMRRNPGWTAGIAATAVFLIASTVVSAIAWRVVGVERDAARRDRDRARTELATIDAERGLIPFEGLARMDLARIESPIVAGMIRRELDDTTMRTFASTSGHFMTGAMSPDGRRWFAASDQGFCAAVDPATGAGEIIRPDRPGPYIACGWSLDGTRRLLCDSRGTLSEVRDGGSTALAETNRALRTILPADDGDRVLLLAWRSLGVFRFSTGAIEWTDAGLGNSLGGLAWHGHGTAYAVLGDRTVAAFEVPDSGPPRRVEEFRFEGADGRSVALSPDGKLVAVGNNYSGVLVADARTGAILQRLPQRHAIWSVLFSRDGRWLHAGDRAGRLHTYRTSDWQLDDLRIADNSEPVWSLGESADGVIVANIGHDIAFFDSRRAWSNTPPPMPVHPKATAFLAPHGVRAIGADGGVRDLDFACGEWVDRGVGFGAAPRLAVLSPDGARGAAICGDELRILEFADGTVRAVPIPPHPATALMRMSWSPDGKLLVRAVEGSIWVYRPDGSILAQSPLEFYESILIAWHGPDRFVAMLTGDTLAECVISAQGISIARRPSHSSINLIRTGGRWVLPLFNGGIAISRAGGAEAIGAAIDEAELRLERHRDHANLGVISPDGTMIATGGADGTMRLWWMPSGEPITVFGALQQQVMALYWFPDGSAIISVGRFGEVRLHDSVPRAERVARDHCSTANPRPAYGQ